MFDGIGGRQLRPDCEQLVLHAGQAVFNLRGKLLGTGQPQKGVQFVDGPIRLDPDIVLADSRSGKQAGFPLVPGFCIDFHSATPLTIQNFRISGLASCKATPKNIPTIQSTRAKAPIPSPIKLRVLAGGSGRRESPIPPKTSPTRGNGINRQQQTLSRPIELETIERIPRILGVGFSGGGGGA
jgi:hypothetical protein